MRRLLLVVSLAWLACDNGGSSLAKARARYQELLSEGRPATDPAFDQVLSQLAKVPPDSSARKDADALAGAIRRARSPRIERPLATPITPGMEAQAQACARLAEQLGRAADAGDRERLRTAVKQCQQKLDEARAAEEKHESESP